MKTLFRFFANDSGATAIEYGLIAAAVGGVLLAVMPSVAGGLNTTFTNISSFMSGGGAPAP
ncbi:Flp family type IVb pilin [Aestuariivirga sp.]|uniref:Flp family type IVb pilin n=1 Tax=Aestuariivirga sp. TaxID=2650926 RepID=UPI00391A0324